MSPIARRLGAWVAVVAFTLGSFALPIANSSHPIWDDDAACGGADYVGPARPHLQFEAVHPLTPAGHCALCHWLRAVGSAAPGSKSVAAVGLDAVDIGLWRLASRHGRLVIVRGASRAPPATAV
jgi:hypothetical protein